MAQHGVPAGAGTGSLLVGHFGGRQFLCPGHHRQDARWPKAEGPEAGGVLATGSGDSGVQTLGRESVARALLPLKAWSGQEVGKHKNQAEEERISELLWDPQGNTGKE